jgi:hypothetical protein
MIKKKIKIFSLVSIILVSTTGLPVTYHLCNMMNLKSLDDCEVCKSESEESNDSCCDAMDTNAGLPAISKDNTSCCHTEFVFNKVEDEFLIDKIDFNFISSTQIISQAVTLIPTSSCISNSLTFQCDSSPPFLINPDLHISNSVFLI